MLNEDFRIVCPGCNKQIEPLTCGFYNCNYFWSGIKKEGSRRINSISKID